MISSSNRWPHFLPKVIQNFFLPNNVSDELLEHALLQDDPSVDEQSYESVLLELHESELELVDVLQSDEEDDESVHFDDVLVEVHVEVDEFVQFDDDVVDDPHATGQPAGMMSVGADVLELLEVVEDVFEDVFEDVHVEFEDEFVSHVGLHVDGLQVDGLQVDGLQVDVVELVGVGLHVDVDELQVDELESQVGLHVDVVDEHDELELD